MTLSVSTPFSGATLDFIHYTYFESTPGQPSTGLSLLNQLPDKLKTLIINYLETVEQDYSHQICRIFPLCEARMNRGWEIDECTDQAIRNLLVQKTTALAADALKRETASRGDVQILTSSFWYANDYFMACKNLKQFSRINQLKDRGDFYHGLPPKGFNRVAKSSLPTGIDLCHYQLAKKMEPSKALANVQQTLCFIDCQEMLEVAFYQTLLHIFGKTKFNQLFRADGPMPLRLTRALEQTPLITHLSPYLPLRRYRGG